jgi:hypothetical protein
VRVSYSTLATRQRREISKHLFLHKEIRNSLRNPNRVRETLVEAVHRLPLAFWWRRGREHGCPFREKGVSAGGGEVETRRRTGGVSIALDDCCLRCEQRPPEKVDGLLRFDHGSGGGFAAR